MEDARKAKVAKGPLVVAAVLALLALILVVSGGCVKRNLHPRFGKASDTIWAKQAEKGTINTRAQMTGEEVGIVMTNHKRTYTVSEIKNKAGGGIGILPIQR
jgi:hypothetical protein